MINLFLNRIFRAIKIDIDVFEEVEKDKNATVQAGIVVVLSSLAAGVGSLHLGASNFLIAPALSLLSWYVWAYIIYFVGVKLFGDNKTKSDHGELLRTIGFSSAPGLIRVFGVTPELMTVTFVGSAFWMLACMVVAVKSALDYDSLWKAFGVVVVSWLVQAFFLFLIIISSFISLISENLETKKLTFSSAQSLSSLVNFLDKKSFVIFFFKTSANLPAVTLYFDK